MRWMWADGVYAAQAIADAAVGWIRPPKESVLSGTDIYLEDWTEK